MSKVVSNLNQLLADLNVLYRKVQNYHWNIKGKEFFQLHAKLEEYYDYINDQIDEVAEKILMAGGQPLGRMKDYLELSKIIEAENEKISAKDVLNSLEKDFKYIKKEILELKVLADEAGDYEISAFADELVGGYSKAIWMISQARL